MFDFLPTISVRRPVLTTMLIAAAVVLGAFDFLRLRTELFPNVEFPVVSVITVYPGAGPEEIESQVTDRIEEAISTLASIDELQSISQQDVSIVIVQFEMDVDVDQAAIDVRDRVETVIGELPDEVMAPIVQKFDISAFPIMNLALSGPQGIDALYEYADDVIRERLSRVSGVAGVDIIGGREREVEVLVDPAKLKAYGVTLTDVVNLIRAENVSVPSGRITEEAADVPVRVRGEYASVQELTGLRLFLTTGGSILLGDVAEVREGFETTRQLARYNGDPAISIAIQKRSDANTVATAAAIRAELDAIRAELPPGMQLTMVRDGSEFIEDSIRDVLSNLLVGMLLTTAVLFLFLHSWRGTVIAATAMPLTIVATFLLMDLAGFTLNVMTLMGLSITVGILVTNTIVVLENIDRYLSAGSKPGTAARRGTSEVAVAVAASTLTNVVVFTPIAFMEGIIGQFFYAFGLTVVFATVFSILISFTLAPLMASRLLKAGEAELAERGRLAFLWRRWEAGFRALEGFYREVLEWAIGRRRNRWIVLGATFVLSIVSLGIAVAFVGGEFIPSGERDAIQVDLKLPVGSPLERTSAVAARAEAILREFDDVDAILTTVSGGGDMFVAQGSGANSAQILVTLKDEARDPEVVLSDVRVALAALPDAELTVTAIDPSQIGGGAQAPIVVRVSGPDYEELRRHAERLTAELATLPALQDVRSAVEDPRPELVFRPDRAALADHGLTVGQVGSLLRTAIEGTEAGVFRGEVGKERDIRVRLTEEARARTSQIGEIEIRTARGSVPLSALGVLEELPTPSSITRSDRVRTVEINANIAPGVSLTGAVAAIQERLDASPLPPGYSYRITGEFEQFSDALGSMLTALILAIVLTYIVLAMILESFIHPITIMLTVPLGAVGAFLGLFLWGASVNIFSMMAIIMLVGIVVNNAILILDYVAQLRKQGLGIIEALLEAGPARLRAIVMTNIAIVFALIPNAVAGGPGAGFRVPMAVVTMGGVLLSAVFTLILIPVIYVMLDRFDVLRPAEEDDEAPGGALAGAPGALEPAAVPAD